MPIKITKESVVLEVGTLVITPSRVCSIPQYAGPFTSNSYPNMADKVIVEPGSIGIILQRPQAERPRQFLVQFVGGGSWWMHHNEIEPYTKETHQ